MWKRWESIHPLCRRINREAASDRIAAQSLAHGAPSGRNQHESPFGSDPLTNALQRLAEGIERYRSDIIADTQIRDGLIQRFAFIYEISHRMIKRFLESASANPEAFDAMPFADLIRTANEQGLLLGNWTDWKRYREMRSRTSHAYDEQIALGVVEGIPAFLAEGEYLLHQLQERNAE